MKKLLTVLLAILMVTMLSACSSNKEESGKTELELVTSLDQAILTLSTGKCDAIALDGTTAENYVAQSDGQFAMSGVNFDLSIYGDYEGNVAAAKKGETTLMSVVNECINTATANNYYTLWTAIAKVQSGTEDEDALAIVGDTPIYNGIAVDDTYNYLLDTTDLVKPNLDLSNATGVLANILKKGVMSIATSPDYPAAEFITEDGTVYGCEMMLAKYVADCLGVALKIETMDFNAVLTAVDTGKVDIAFSGFGWKADRAEAFELSVGYVGDDSVTYHTLIVPADQADNYHSLSDFVGKHIVAQASSLQQMYVEDQIIALEN
ncbi:MAG: transporter substrate-binding domain-containing protein [Erysipelotrichaceae bacterium]|nr:transporter substrate-binding domain-containing protein [Erysipelotrichaceae bacterium]